MGPDAFVDEALKLPLRSQAALAAVTLERVMEVMKHRLKERGDEVLIEDVISLGWQMAEEGVVPHSEAAEARDACLEAAPHTEDDPEAADVTFTLTAAAAVCDLIEGSDPREALRGVVFSALDAIEHFEGSKRDADRSTNGEPANLTEELVPVVRELEKLGEGRPNRSQLSQL